MKTIWDLSKRKKKKPRQKELGYRVECEQQPLQPKEGRRGHEAVVNLTAWCEEAWEMRGTGHDRGERFWRDVLVLIQISLSD